MPPFGYEVSPSAVRGGGGGGEGVGDKASSVSLGEGWIQKDTNERRTEEMEGGRV